MTTQHAKQSLLLAALWAFPAGLLAAGPDTVHVWQKVEITLAAQNSYGNPYREVSVWVDLAGPGFQKRCYGFWDGGATFRVQRSAYFVVRSASCVVRKPLRNTHHASRNTRNARRNTQ